MALEIGRDGNFSLTVGSEQLSKGLRPSVRLPRNNGFMLECSGAVGIDGVLTTLDQLTRMSTDTITDGFPYPQIFVFVNMIIVCGKTNIYEWVDGALVLKLTVDEGSTWTAIDFFDYVYLSNSVVAVIKDSASKVYSITTALPAVASMCNFHGQVVIGGPDMVVPLIMKATPIDLTVTQHGSWSNN